MPKFELDSTWFEYPVVVANEDEKGIAASTSTTTTTTVSNDNTKQHDRNAFIPKTIVKLRIKGSAKSIPASTFSDQPKLTYLEIQEGVQKLGDYCFYKCPYLFEVHCPLSLGQMGVYAFAQATLLTEVTLPSDGSLSIIPASAFEYCESLTTVGVPASVKSIHHYAFFHCTSLKDINFETKTCSARILGLVEIHDHAFGSCASLTEVKLPSTLIKLFSNSFCDCIRLQQVKMAEGLQTVERRAFSGCTALKHLEIPSTVEDFILEDVKEGCHSRLKVKQRSPGDVFFGIGNVDKDLYSSDQDFLYRATTRNVSAATMRMKQSIRSSMNDDKCFNLCSIM
mmetsp:Transcript_8334/g.20064  ORF Transcript_8334/g.20064 Transcript_8334/m.20064 type:complete len:339 (-) Transcript_8334:252-1268(-)|eukprot:CAMPEP_0113618322 /NCGR_PEP_ID=MMETSP0017_2-20120614/9271_1 /TAXON_ID=2856 /ORGANISM="Cylindrotheca closterium" /LENGTH=338 /DNA_ID=CAMNT_0000527815 /DNA_START=33 /DNA_END=1049 /DNA_ORIENTATION=+ /assembly_acc=CAM_ASM_000147